MEQWTLGKARGCQTRLSGGRGGSLVPPPPFLICQLWYGHGGSIAWRVTSQRRLCRGSTGHGPPYPCLVHTIYLVIECVCVLMQAHTCVWGYACHTVHVVGGQFVRLSPCLPLWVTGISRAVRHGGRHLDL